MRFTTRKQSARPQFIKLKYTQSLTTLERNHDVIEQYRTNRPNTEKREPKHRNY